MPKKIVAKELKLPPGYALVWSGQYENMIRVKERMKVVLPLTLFLILSSALHEHEIGDEDRDRGFWPFRFRWSGLSGFYGSWVTTFRSRCGSG